MTNLVVADSCNLNCPFCFARDYLEDSHLASGLRFITLDDFRERLDFLDRSGITEIRLIGGEPSLHPRFSELIALARQREKRIVVFSHGFLAEAALVCLEALPAEQCTVLININATHTPGRKNIKEQQERSMALHRLGPRALLGFNIFETNFQLDFLLQLILDTGCRKTIRLGLAHPSLSGRNAYLHPKQYPIIGRRLIRFAQMASQVGVKLELDCGFVRCMFSEADLEFLQQARADIGWRCNPILDVDLTGQVFHCFPLQGKVQTQLYGDAVAGDLRKELLEQTRHYRAAGIYKECSICSFKQNGNCTGGCLANTMRRFRQAAIHVHVPKKLSPLLDLSEGLINSSKRKETHTASPLA